MQVSSQYLKAKTYASIFIGLLVMLCRSVSAQQFNFQPLQDGPTSNCYRVIQDRKGYIWISTEEGLCRYDGRSYKWFHRQQNGTPLRSVFQLEEDAEGRILFTTVDSRVGYVYHDSVFFPSMNKQLEHRLLHGKLQILEIYVDKDGILWIATCRGLYRTLSPEDYSELKYVVPPLGTDLCHVGIEIVDNKESLLFINQMEQLKDNAGRIYHIFINNQRNVIYTQFHLDKSQIPPSYLKSLMLPNGNILLSEDNKLFTITQKGDIKSSEVGGNIIYLYQGQSNSYWIGLWNKGLLYYPNGIGQGMCVQSLKGKNVSSVIEDNEGGIWASTFDAGVFYANSQDVINYNNRFNPHNELKAITAVDSKIVVNDGSNNLDIIDGDSIGKIGVPTNHVPMIALDYYLIHDKVYILTTSGVFVTDTLLNKNCRILYLAGAKNSAGLYHISVGSDGTLYGISYATISKISNSNVTVIDTLPTRGMCIYIDANNTMFLGCSNGLYEHKNHKNVYLGNTDKFLSGAINVIKKDNKGNIWIGTSSYGLGLYKDGAVKERISESNGLASDMVKDIAFDHEGDIWVATDKGLSKIMTSKGYAVENYDTRHGLTSKEVNELAIQGQYLWLATKEGVNRIDMLHLSENRVPPPVYISNVYVNDSSVVGAHDFKYEENNLMFDIAGLTFKSGTERYLYRMVGLDTTWHYSNLAEVPFNNLSPGKYRFEAKAVNADGVESTVPASYSFIIEPPFWLRWWFIMGEVIAFGGVVYGFIKYRLRLIQKKEAEKTRINKMLAEYQMTALTAQMNPHFVFNAINSIQDYVLGNDTQKAYDYLTKFSQLVRVILYNAKEKTITLERELESLKMYVELEELRFEGKFQFIYEVGKEVDVYGIQLPSMIIQPYVENAIWHGLMPLGGKRKGILKVNISQQGNLLKIIVEDNGIGREESKKIRKSTGYKSVGMEITRDRINVLNSLLESGESEINIYDLYDEEVKPAGTRVEIKITVNKD